jgi:hypothetical protein
LALAIAKCAIGEKKFLGGFLGVTWSLVLVREFAEIAGRLAF